MCAIWQCKTQLGLSFSLNNICCVLLITPDQWDKSHLIVSSFNDTHSTAKIILVAGGENGNCVLAFFVLLLKDRDGVKIAENVFCKS